MKIASLFGLGSCVLMLSMAVLPGAALRADEEVLTAAFTSRAGPNAYSVNLPPHLGGQVLDMPIVGGQFQLAVDGEEGSARLLNWRQEIEPVEIYGYSSGPIVVRMDETQGSSGLYRPESSTFSVTATFILEFDDRDLSQLGFMSPFILTATENGTIYGVGKIGTISMNLAGSGTFSQGEFTYTCHTSAEFITDLPDGMGQPGDVNRDFQFDVSDPIAGLRTLFQGEEVECPGAIEVNADGTQDLSDVIYMLNFLFLGDAPPSGEPVECALQG